MQDTCHQYFSEGQIPVVITSQHPFEEARDWVDIHMMVSHGDWLGLCWLMALTQCQWRRPGHWLSRAALW